MYEPRCLVFSSENDRGCLFWRSQIWCLFNVASWDAAEDKVWWRRESKQMLVDEAPVLLGWGKLSHWHSHFNQSSNSAADQPGFMTHWIQFSSHKDTLKPWDIWSSAEDKLQRSCCFSSRHLPAATCGHWRCEPFPPMSFQTSLEEQEVCWITGVMRILRGKLSWKDPDPEALHAWPLPSSQLDVLMYCCGLGHWRRVQSTYVSDHSSVTLRCFIVCACLHKSQTFSLKSWILGLPQNHDKQG